MPRPSPFTNALSPSERRRSVASTRESPAVSVTSRRSTGIRAVMPRPSRCTNALTPSRKNYLARSIRVSPSVSVTSRMLYQAQGRYAEAEPLLKRALSIQEKAFGPEIRMSPPSECPRGPLPGARPLCRGRAFDQTGPGHQREGPRSRASRCRPFAGQPRDALPGTGPLCRGRAVIQTGPRHQRESIRSRASGCSHQSRTISRRSTRHRAAMPRPSRCTSVR